MSWIHFKCPNPKCRGRHTLFLYRYKPRDLNIRCYKCKSIYEFDSDGNLTEKTVPKPDCEETLSERNIGYDLMSKNGQHPE